MAQGESVSIAGFGTFSVKDRAARQGRNPQTGEAISSQVIAVDPDISDRVRQLGSHDADSFSALVIQGALHALSDKDNPLRFTFFAAAMRILFEHLMDELAPRDDVRACDWFRPETDDARPTRRQRIKFAIQGGLANRIVEEELRFESEPLKSALLSAIDRLSRHVHVREDTVVTDRAEQDCLALSTVEAMEEFLATAQHCRNAVLAPIADALDRPAVHALVSETIQALDELASHHSIGLIDVGEIEVARLGHQTVTYRVIGSIDVDLQWGSGSDLRRGDGAELSESFPFSCELTLPICQPWDLSLARTECDVDTREWYC